LGGRRQSWNGPPSGLGGHGLENIVWDARPLHEVQITRQEGEIHAIGGLNRPNNRLIRDSRLNHFDYAFSGESIRGLRER